MDWLTAATVGALFVLPFLLLAFSRGHSFGHEAGGRSRPGLYDWALDDDGFRRPGDRRLA